MKALSLTQPWASLVVLGMKRWETRRWRTSYRGYLLIHASKRLPAECQALCREEPFKSALGGHVLPTGAIIGQVKLTGCFGTASVDRTVREYFGGLRIPPDDRERAFGDYSPGRWAFRLENPVWFSEPLPYSGSLGIFEVLDDGLLTKALLRAGKP